MIHGLYANVLRYFVAREDMHQLPPSVIPDEVDLADADSRHSLMQDDQEQATLAASRISNTNMSTDSCDSKTQISNF